MINTINYAIAVGALKESIKTVEERVRKLNDASQKIISDSTADFIDENALIDDLDDLHAAKIVQSKVESLFSGPNLNTEQNKWLSILFWDGNGFELSKEAMLPCLLRDGPENEKGTVSEALCTQQQHKYVNPESLRCLVLNCFEVEALSAKWGLREKIEWLLSHFAPDLQVSVVQSYRDAITIKIKSPQIRSFNKLTQVMNELEEYAKILPEGAKKTAINALVYGLYRCCADYKNFLENPSNTLEGFAGRKIFFHKNRTFVNVCMSVIKANETDVDLHRNHNLKMILANLLIAITGVGLFALGARYVYSLIDPSATILFFTKTRSRAKVDKLKSTLSELEEVKPSLMTSSAMLATNAT